MKYYACIRLYASDVSFRSGGWVVEVGAGDQVSACFPLEEERASTQWIGGIIILSPFRNLTRRDNESFSMFLCRATAVVADGSPLYAWHVADFNFQTNDFASGTRLYCLNGSS